MKRQSKMWFGFVIPAMASGMMMLVCNGSAYAQITTGIGGGGTSFGGGGGGGGFGGGGAGGAGGATNAFGFSGGTSQGFIGTSNVVGPQPSNPFQQYYFNPYSIAQPQNSANFSGGGGAGMTGGSTSGIANQTISGVFGTPRFQSGTGGTTRGFAGGATGGRTGGTTGGFGGGATGGRTGGTTGGGFGGGTTGGRTGGTTGGIGGGTTGGGFGGGATGGRTGGTAGGIGGAGGRTGGIAGGATGGFGGTAGGFGGAGRTGGIAGGVAGGFGGTNIGAQGFSTAGMVRAPNYVTTLGHTIQPRVVAPAQLRARVNNVILGSPVLNTAGINVGAQGRTVVLRGAVNTAQERRLAENMVRLTPGVRNVRNEITVRGGSNP